MLSFWRSLRRKVWRRRRQLPNAFSRAGCTWIWLGCHLRRRRWHGLSTTSRRKATRNSLIGCWGTVAMVNDGAVIGWIWRAMERQQASKATAPLVTFGAIVIG